MNHFSIAIDGPAGAGKSTVAKLLANKLKIDYIDTGAMYRAFTFKLINKYISNNLNNIVEVLKTTSIDFKDGHIYLDNIIIDEEIRDNSISKNVSQIAKIKEVRDRLVELQREIAKNKSTVMDGRDIGSMVLKDAEYKFFITASVEERASRRYRELSLKDDTLSLDSIKHEIEKRDLIDSTREISPLVQCEDAILIDTTDQSIDEVVESILKFMEMDN